jgi:cholest-4-en-3-one 26-monooxygenase
MAKFECPHIELLKHDNFLGGPPREAYRELRQTRPVCWQADPYGKSPDAGYWAVTTQEHLDFVSKNPQIFSSQIKGAMAPDPEDMGQGLDPADNMLTMDPPKHLKYRRIVRNAFTPAIIESYAPHFREVAAEIVGRVLSRGECEFVEDIASELPLIAICEIVGVPTEDRQQFFKWSNTMIGGDDPDYAASPQESSEAMFALWNYADKIMEQNRDKSTKKNNVVSTLLNANVDGEYLEPQDFRTFMMLLVVAGNETTRNQTSQLMRLLIEHPDQYQMLVDDPSLVEHAVEEALRYNSPVISFRRTAVQDCELGGRQIRKGQKVILFYQSASSDEKNFKDPDTFDITRPKREAVRENLRAFGIGEHFCLGSHLARLELNVIMGEIVRRIRNPKFNGEVKWLYSHFINGIKQMPIKFDTV